MSETLYGGARDGGKTMTVNAINKQAGYNVITLHKYNGEATMGKKIETIRLTKDIVRTTKRGTAHTFRAGEVFDVVGSDAQTITVDTPPLKKGEQPWRIVIERKRKEFEEGEAREVEETATADNVDATAADGTTATAPVATGTTVTRPTPTVGSTVPKP